MTPSFHTLSVPANRRSLALPGVAVVTGALLLAVAPSTPAVVAGLVLLTAGLSWRPALGLLLLAVL